MKRHRTLRIALCLVLVGSLFATPAIAAGPPEPASQERAVETASATSTAERDAATSAGSAATTARTIELTQELQRTPDVPGEIAVTLRYTVPADVVELETRLPAGATVTSTSGFVQAEGTHYRWTRQNTTPTITYRVPVNETLDVEGPIAGKGEYIFVDPGPWALVRVPPTSTRWGWTGGGTVGLSRTVTTAGPGAVSDSMAFLGDHREVTRTANGQTFRLIVPDQATLTESPETILDSIAAASGSLQVGDRDEHVFMVAAPTRNVRWGIRGLQTGSASMWVRDGERLATADNVWLHEYVHTRQGYTAARDARWFTEASATYYAASLTLEQQRIDFQAFRDRLAIGTRTPDRTAILEDPATWNTIAPYTKGALVAGDLDRRIRLASERSRSLQTVFSWMNSHGTPVTGAALREMVRQAGGDAVATQSDRYTTTTETPPMWDQQAHEQALGTPPARIGYALPGAESPTGYSVSGPYRSGPVGKERPIRLTVGETLTMDVRVSNTGGAAGTYDAQLLSNGKLLTRQGGQLQPGETKRLTFTHRFTQIGEYVLSVGGDRVAVSVRRPAKPTVTKVEPRKTRSRSGARTIKVSATVRNDHPFPAADNLTLVHNGEAVETVHVKLAPNQSRTISFNETPVEPGEHVYRVDERTATVTVESTPTATPRTTATSQTTTRGDGFGVVLSLVAFAGLLLVLAGRR